MSRTWSTLPYKLWIEHPSTPIKSHNYQTNHVYDCKCQGDWRCNNWRHRTKTEEVVSEEYKVPLKRYGCLCCGPADADMANRSERRKAKEALFNWDEDEFTDRYVRYYWW